MPARSRGRNNEHWHGHKLLSIGVLIFIVGLMLQYGYGWAEIFMVIGALVFLKGLYVKFGKK